MILIPVLGLVLNTQKKEAFSVVEKVMEYLKKKKVNYLLEKEAAEIMEISKNAAALSEMRKNADYIIVFGGDGTFLHTAHYFFDTEIPLLGINIGRLGFLTEIEINELEDALEDLLTGNFELQKRMILATRVISTEREVYRNHALNDVVINRGAKSRMVNIELYINDEIVTQYRADGIITATPTGSTAYSLSAGGPIVNPQVRAMLVTPICPHTLYIRPMVIADHEELKIIIRGGEFMKITADGRYDYNLSSGDEIRISAAREELNIIKLPGRTFYNILHRKMRVGLV